MPANRLLAVAVSLCVASGLNPAAAAGDGNFLGRWITAKSDHFVIYGSAGARVTRRALEDAERTLAGLRLALTLNGEFPDDHRTLTLVLFLSDGLYKSFAPPRTSGVFQPAVGWGETDLVLLRGAGRFQVLHHELVHRLMQPVLPKAPPWLAEGMAQYFQWTQIGETSITVGITPETPSLQRAMHDSNFFPPLSQLIATPRPAFFSPQAPGLYSASYWLISTLNSDADHRKRLNQAIQAMASGSSGDVAWKRAFTPDETEALDREYRSSPSRWDPVSHRFAWQAPVPRISETRLLTAAEVHILLARLYGRTRPSDARGELNTAIDLDPTSAEAFALRALLAPSRPESRRDAERSVALEPDALLGWEALGLALLPASTPADSARLRDVIGRLESFKESAESHCLGAVLLDATGDRAGALKLARAAVRISPGSFYDQAILARVAPGGSREAEEARARAWVLAPDGVDPAALEQLIRGGRRGP